MGLIAGAGGRGDDVSNAVLVAGGMGEDGPLRSAEIYDAGKRRWRRVAPMRHARVAAAAAMLPRHQVLVTGGLGAGGKALASTEIFDLASETWHDAPPLITARGKHAAVALGDGRVLVLGGAEAIELFDPGRDRFRTVAHTDAARLFATATAFGAGGTLVAGGYDSEIHPSAAATVIR